MILKLKGKGFILGSIEDLEDSGRLQEFCVFQRAYKVYADDVDITPTAKLRISPEYKFVYKYYCVTESKPYYFRVPTKKVDLEFTFEIEGEFDIKKLKLIVTCNDLPFIGYGCVIADRIIYNNEVLKFIDNDANLANYDKLPDKLNIEVIE